MSLDFSVSQRQTLSNSFRAADVEALLSGTLTIPPHPQWILPAQINWRSDPFKDRNWRLQLHMLRWLDPLRRAASKGDDRAYAMWIDYVEQWVEANPPEKPMSGWAWKDMADGIRVQQFCLAAPLVRDRSPEKLDWLEATIRTHAEHLADPAHMGIANHALHQQEALFVCGRVLKDSTFWQLAIDRMSSLLQEQYDTQGVNAEGAIAYHYNNYIWWERALKRLDLERVPRPVGAERHLSAPEQIAHATRPDGQMVSIGDTDGGTPKAARTPQTDYVSSNGEKGTPPDEVVKVYDAGYIFGRSGWGETERAYDEETYFSVSFGDSRRVHGHADGGSLTYSADSVNWVVDPGKHQYGRSTARDHFFSRGAHSLLSIAGREPRKEANVSLRHHLSSARHHDFLFDDDSFEGIKLSRRIVYSVSGEYLVVVDHVTSQEECTGTQRWQLGSGVTASLSGNRVELAAGDHRAALCFSGTRSALEEVTGQDDPFDGWVSTGWKKKERATAITASKTGRKFRFITVLATGRGVHPTITSHRGIEPGQFCLEVETGRTREFVLVGRNEVSFPSAPPNHGGAPGLTPKAAAIRPTKTGRPHHLDRTSRSEVFDLLESARCLGVDATAEARSAKAQELHEQAAARGFDDDIDLGIAAGITDLLPETTNHRGASGTRQQRTALVNWSGDESWRPTSYPLPVVSHHQGFTLPRRPEQTAIHTVAAGPLILPFALDPSEGETLTVLFQGAIDRARIRLPIFQRWRHQIAMAAGPTIAFSDPTLDLSTSLGLGWHLGTESTDLVPIIVDTIRDAADALGVHNVVLAGGSGGGFTALHVGALLEDSVVVAFSPQVDLREYSPRLTRAAMQTALGLRQVPVTGSAVRRISAVERMRRTRSYPRTYLVSNRGDVHHTTRHEKPLQAAYAKAGHASLLQKVEVDLGPGHRAPDNELYSNLLANVYAEF
ncbi:heparinase II/III family protein [Brachybacterium sp. FME24]|uniref:heparinase II/III family protein n=1 Tax=Brachybacterium sp. FME24 TaxID=2742605 RepID=UPI0018691B49|nr:heparinase II/III family protein [Brachybacterium sp. FME24]